MSKKQNLSQEDIDNMAFPMKALGKVHVGKAEYARGDIFDAQDIDNVNFLKSTKSAEVLSGVTVEPDEAASASTVPDQGTSGSATGAGESSQSDSLETGAQGTTNVADTEGTVGGGRRTVSRKR